MTNRPAKPQAIRDRIAHYVQEYTQAKLIATTGQKGAVQKYICQIWNVPETRHLCVWWLMGGDQAIPQVRMNQLSDAQVMALKMWIAARPDEAGAWQPDPALQQEAQWIQWEAERIEQLLSHQLPLGAEAVNQGGRVAETGTDPDAKPESETMTFGD